MYTGMMYHVDYDTTYLRSGFMNYPYGEHVYFTYNQPLISNTIKFLDESGVDISGYIIGITNGLMIFSILLGSILLYLVFLELGLVWWLSALAGLGIAFLSPQLDRFYGHFTLGYVFAIPLFILLLLRFFRKPSWLLSAGISITSILAALTHFYLYGFFALLAIFFYAGYALAGKKIWNKRYSWLLHLFVQFIIPFLLLQSLYLADAVTDRPEYPWGFLRYRAYPQGILLPLLMPYGHFLKNIFPIRYIQWEGIAFVGSIAALFTIVLTGYLFVRLFQRRFNSIPDVTGNLQLNILFWSAVAALLYSFGIPFILGMEWLIDYIGPLRQMRGIGRFSWLFYYIINITVFYWLWNDFKIKTHKLLPVSLIVISLLVLYADAYMWVKPRGEKLENYMPELRDVHNDDICNQWIKRVQISDFQAILPVPYFHVGSENVWIEHGCGIQQKAFITGVRTGLPSMGVFLSRTSISQTCNNLALMLEPTGGAVCDMRFPSDKPLLLLAARCDELNNNEQRLIRQAQWIDSTLGFDIYSLPVSAFRTVYLMDAAHADSVIGNGGLHKVSDYLTSGTTDRAILVHFDSLQASAPYAGTGCYTGISNVYNRVFDASLPLADTAITYIGSLWIGNFRTDLMPRSDLIVTQTDSSGKEISSETWTLHNKLEAIDGNWARIEWTFRLKDPSAKVQVFLYNRDLKKKELLVDELMIRPSEMDVYSVGEGWIMKNNRFYFSSDISSL